MFYLQKIIHLVVFFTITLLAGCKEETKTTKWYRDNPTELEKVYSECQKSGDGSENCKNANEAHYQLKQMNAPVTDFNDL